MIKSPSQAEWGVATRDKRRYDETVFKLDLLMWTQGDATITHNAREYRLKTFQVAHIGHAISQSGDALQ